MASLTPLKTPPSLSQKVSQPQRELNNNPSQPAAIQLSQDTLQFSGGEKSSTASSSELKPKAAASSTHKTNAPATAAPKNSTTQTESTPKQVKIEIEPADTKKTWGRWAKNQPKVWWQATKSAFKPGEHWASLPFKGWKSDMLWFGGATTALALLVPPHLPQLLLFPVLMGLGGALRSTYTLLKGTYNPDSVLKPKEDTE